MAIKETLIPKHGGYRKLKSFQIAQLILLTVACSLLDRQIAAQAKAFETEGGFTERLYRIRTENRKSRFSSGSTQSTKSTPSTKSTGN